MDSVPTASDQVARRVRELITDRKMTVPDLAARCADAGMPSLTAQTLYKLAGQRDPAKRKPRPVSVDELLVLARALDVPVPELLPVAGADDDPPRLREMVAYLRATFRQADREARERAEAE